jgi:hypothetical protein
VTAAPEFPTLAQAAELLNKLDEHRRRQALAMLAERYGFNLPPSQKRIERTTGKGNASEFPAMEEAAELLDGLSAQQQELALGYLVGLSSWKIQPAFKPPPRGFSSRRKHTRG